LLRRIVGGGHIGDRGKARHGGLADSEHMAAQLGWTGDNGDPDNFFIPLAGCAAARIGGGTAGDFNPQGGYNLVVKVAQNNPNIVFAESQGGNMNRINLTTGQSSAIRPQPAKGDDTHRWNWNTPLVTAAATGKKATPVYNLYTGSQCLYRSQDEGRSWQRLSPDLTTNDKAKLPSANTGGITGDNTSAENHCTIFV